MIMFGIYDLKAEHFFAPFFERSIDSAIRALAVQFSDDSMLARYPEDFVLFKLAHFDPESGAVTDAERVKVCRVDDIYRAAQKKGVESGVSDEVRREGNA